MESRRTKRKPRGFLLILGGLICLFSVGLMAVWWILNQEEPGVSRPVVALPNPNAYDLYIAAGQARVNAHQIDSLTILPIAAGTPEERKALEQLEAAIRKEEPALKLLHQGFAYDYCNPPKGPGAVYPEFAVFRGLARLVAMQSRVRAARGDWGGAADSALDAIRLGEDIPHGGTVIAELVGDACQAIGQRPMWQTVDHLNAAQSRAAARRLEAIMDRHVSYSEVMQEEQWFGQEDLRKVLRSVNMHNALAKVNDFGMGQMPAPDRYRMAIYLLFGKKTILHNQKVYMDQLIAMGKGPYNTPLPPIPTDPISQLAMPVFSSARMNVAYCETLNRLLLVALALRAYRLEHGRAADSLDQLTPTYIKKLPDDPFAAQGTFQYHLKGTVYVLYSLGPDGKDDDGTPIDDPNQITMGATGRQRYRVQAGSRGDIVAGINYP